MLPWGGERGWLGTKGKFGSVIGNGIAVSLVCALIFSALPEVSRKFRVLSWIPSAVGIGAVWLGAEVSAPFLGDAARDLGFTNEGGVGGTFRLLKNVTGLWLVQECRRAFGAELEDLDHAALEAAAFAAEPLRTLIDPDDPPFREPGDMPGKIAAFAARTGQPVPRTPGEHVRCCLESLALAYRDVLARLESVLDRRCEVIHVVGGGARSALLNQLTASATGRDLLVGPVEATALGNALVQAIADGAVASVAAARTMVRASEPPIRIAGGDAAAWDAAAERFAALGRVRRDGG